MRPKQFLAVGSLVLFFFFLPAQSQSRRLIATPIDNASRVLVPQSHLTLKSAADLGPVSESALMERMFLVLKMAPEQQHAVATLLDSQQTKGSPNYHRWLTPDQYGQLYGPAPEDVAQVIAWLRQQGFSIGRVAKSGMWIEFSGSAGQVNRAFNTQLRRYRLKNDQHIANATDLSIPMAMAPLVAGVPLHDLFSKPALVRSPTVPAISNSAGAHAVTPGDFAAIYDVGPLYKAGLTGSGQTIAIVSKSNINLSDVAQFQKIFGLPANVPNVIVNGVDPGVVPSGFGAEAMLDTEWSAAVAPGARIVIVPTWDTGTTDGVVLSASYIVDENLAQIMNVSYTNCEPNLGTAGNAFWSSLWQQAAAQGISVFVASGDSGAAACAATGLDGRLNDFAVSVNGLASTPFNTAIGGTEFDEKVNGGSAATYWNSTNSSNFTSAFGYIPETAWNDEFTAAPWVVVLGTGGGVSTVYPTPSWQTLNVTGLQALSNYSLPGQTGVSPRGIPDVSLNASPVNDPYLFCFTDPFTPNSPDCQLQNGTFGPSTFQNAGGGTSFGSPTFAGLMALINQKMLSDHPGQSAPDGRQGLANYVLYPLAVAEDLTSCNSSNRTNPKTPAPAACVFNDVTSGNNNDPDVAGYNAAVGYDLVTGLGSVDASNLVAAWPNATASFHGSQTTLTTMAPNNAISIQHGQAATFDAAVQKLGADSTSQVPSGAVSLIAQGGTLTNSVGVALAPLSGSPATTGAFSTNLLPGGTYNVLANFAGDGYFAGSSSNTIPVTVAPEATTTTLYSYATQPYGTSIGDFGVMVAGASGQGVPSGQVTLSDNGVQFAQIQLNNQGFATFLNCPFPGGIQTPAPSPLPCFMPGTHIVTATYAGDGSFSASSNPPAASQTATLIVTKGEVFPAIGPRGNNTNLINAPVQFTVLLGGVSPAAVVPTGTVQFFDGSTLLGQGTLAGNPAQTATGLVTLSQGTHIITVNYSGDSLYSAESRSETFYNGVPIGWSGTTTTQTINPGQTATYNYTLSTASGFTGAVPLSCIAGTDPFNPATPPTGTACTVSPATATFTATATSIPVTVTVTTTSLTQLTPFPWGTLPFALAGVLALGARGRRRKGGWMVASVVLAISALASCGGGGSSNPPPYKPPAATATFTVWAQYPGSPNETIYSGVVTTTNVNP